MPETVGWNANTEKLLCLVVVSDARAQELSPLAGEAFFRAFIVEDRASGAVSMKFRFRYSNGEDAWFSVKPQPQQERLAAYREFREGMAEIITTASEMIGVPLSPLDIKCFEPPDDEGDCFRTIQWLVDRDLIYPPRIEAEKRA